MLNKITSDTGSITYQYNKDDSLKSETDPNGNSVEYTYSGKEISSITVKDKKGKIVGKNQYSYNNDGMLTAIKDKNEKNIVTYDYDEQNNISKKQAGSNITVTYNYSETGDLSKLSVKSNQKNIRNYNYSYGLNGSLVK